MKQLSISQSFMLCALNEKGKIPALRLEVPVCIFAGGVLDLWMHDCITIENKKISAKGQLPDSLSYLKDIYDAVAGGKPTPIDKLTSAFCFTLTNKRLNNLIRQVGDSLSAIDCVNAGLEAKMGKGALYIPDKTEVEGIIQTIRAEFLEEGRLSDETIALAVLLEKNDMIKNYFSKHESSLMKTRLKEIKKSPEHKLTTEIVDYVTIMITVIATV